MKRIMLFAIIVSFLLTSTSFAKHHEINFTVSYKTVNVTGSARQAIVVNNQLPGPTLHFKEGDHVIINVKNELDKETAIHWHGMLLPWQMDGVLGITQQGIKPGNMFRYQFTLHQSGTYWYHAHAGLQEQQGLYGAFIVDPVKPPHYQYNKDYVIVLSDWSNTHPDKILANLKKDGDYYSPDFPLQGSLSKFIHDYGKANANEKRQLLDDYKSMQQTRMGLYDLSDVAYDAFLLNGNPSSMPWTAPVSVGDIVRLRFIGAGGSTIFHVKIPGSTMQMVHIEGNDVKPYPVDDFTIAPGETYDVLVKIKKNDPYLIYAESLDTVGAAFGALLTNPNQLVNLKTVTSFPEPTPVSQTMMANMMGGTNQGTLPSSHTANNSMPDMHGMKMDRSMPMHHNMAMNISMPTEPTIIGDRISPPEESYKTSVSTKYQLVTAAVKTNDPNKPIAGVIKMELFGYMDRYIWFINGEPEYKVHPIVLQPGKRYRFVFTNTSMMHHPMHLHGHWFILRKGNNAYDPLLHTIDVPPGTTITADVDTDASGQWLFHCHLLYHMMTGMSRVFQYSTLLDITRDHAAPEDIVEQTAYQNRPIVRVDEVRPIEPALVKHPMAHITGWWYATALDVGVNPVTNDEKITFKGLYGADYDKLELFTNDAEMSQGKVEYADIDIFYWHLLDQYWAVKGGINYFYRPANTPYWQPGIGIEGMTPYFIDTDVRGYYYGGSVKADIDLSRDTQITNNFFIKLGIRSILASKTVTQAEIGSGLNQMQYTIRPYYRVMPGLNIFAEFEREQYYGRFKQLELNDGESATQNTLTFGLSLLF